MNQQILIRNNIKTLLYLKNLIGKSKAIRGFYYWTFFLKAAVLNDLLRPDKLILFFKVLPYTMVSYERLSNAYELAEKAEKEGVKGAFVECGVWKGGTIGVMAYSAAKARSSRQIWLFDSFEGLPEPTKQDGETAIIYSSDRKSGSLVSIGRCVGLLEDVKRLFVSILHLKGDNIQIEKGWFQDTLPEAKERVGPIAILRLDADWYESTKCILENLYENVVSGGYVIIDDYGHWEGCKKAVDEFFEKRNVSLALKTIDDTGVYFQVE